MAFGRSSKAGVVGVGVPGNEDLDASILSILPGEQLPSWATAELHALNAAPTYNAAPAWNPGPIPVAAAAALAAPARPAQAPALPPPAAPAPPAAVPMPVFLQPEAAPAPAAPVLPPPALDLPAPAPAYAAPVPDLPAPAPVLPPPAPAYVAAVPDLPAPAYAAPVAVTVAAVPDLPAPAPALPPPAPDLPAPAPAYAAPVPVPDLPAPAYAAPVAVAAVAALPAPAPAYAPPATPYAPVLAVPVAAAAMTPAAPPPAALWTGSDPLAWAADPASFSPEQVEDHPEAPAEPDLATTRSRRPVRLALLAVGLAAVGALVYFVVLPMLNGSSDEGAAPAGPQATLVRPAALAGLPLVADAAASSTVRAATGAPVRANPMLMAAGYGKGGKVQLAVSTSVTNSPENPAAGITSRFAAFHGRTKAALGKPITVSVPRTTMQCAPAAASKALPAGSLCVWVDPLTAGQVWLVGATPANAAVVAQRARSSVVHTS